MKQSWKANEEGDKIRLHWCQLGCSLFNCRIAPNLFDLLKEIKLYLTTHLKLLFLIWSYPVFKFKQGDKTGVYRGFKKDGILWKITLKSFRKDPGSKIQRGKSEKILNVALHSPACYLSLFQQWYIANLKASLYYIHIKQIIITI